MAHFRLSSALSALSPSSRQLRLARQLRPVRQLCLIAAIALGAVATTSAFAPVEASAQARGRKQKSYDFEDDVIETQFLRPDVATTEGVKKDKRRSLIRIRKDFFAELIRSAEDL